MNAPEFIQTERLIMRRPVASDAGAIFERYAGDPLVTRYLAWPRHATIEDTIRFLEFSDKAWSGSSGGPYLVVSNATGMVLGSAGFAFEEPERASVGYVLAQDAWGKGYATEALDALVAVARQMGVARLRAYCHPDHAASIRVLEKCGFAIEKGLRNAAAFPNLGAASVQEVLSYAMELADGSAFSACASAAPVIAATGDQAAVRIEYLADYPEHIPRLSRWFYAQWSWFLPPESSASTIEVKFHTHLNRDALPLALVALHGDELLGTASLRVNDMDILSELSPWLGGVYVTKNHRQKGIARQLVNAVELKALELGYRSLYLFTYDHAPMYSKLGWDVLKQLEYHGYPVVVMHKSLSAT